MLLCHNTYKFATDRIQYDFVSNSLLLMIQI